MKLSELAAKCKLTCEKNKIKATILDDWQRKAHQWRCTISYQGRRYSFDYFMGSALTGEPTAADVLDSLLSDSEAGTMGLDEFSQEFGYAAYDDAKRIHKACQRTHFAMIRLLGDDYDTFASAERE